MGWIENRPHLPEKRCQFAGSCAGSHAFGTDDAMIGVIDRSTEVSRSVWLRNCQVRYENGDLMEFMELQQRFPKSYSYHKSSFEGLDVYFFEWSMIEFFWKERR